MKVQTLEAYRQEKNKILKQYEYITGLNLLPIGEITDETINERVASLHAGRFYISVCGQMKAGKSTLLNALLFDENILPVDDTVMTAKITLIEYHDNPGIKVEFYSTQEWEALQKQYEQSSSPEYLEQWKDDLNSAIEQGIYYQEVIASPAREKRDALAELTKYVALPQQGGVYAPYVKSVAVYLPKEFLREVIIVDTPGINDPNQVRSNLTKDWIQRADAVIYVSYAGQAMAAPDVDFINDYLLHVPAQRRILAINKIDAVSSQQELEESLSLLERSPEVSLRSIFGGSKTTCYVSALGALISQMKLQKKPLDENLREMEEILTERENYLDPSLHRFEEFKQEVQRKLIENKGDDILTSHRDFQKSLFEKAALLIEREISSEQQQLELLSKTHAQLEEEKKRIDETRNELETLTRKFRNELKDVVEDNKHKLYEILRSHKSTVVRGFSEELSKITSIGTLHHRVCWILKDQLERLQISLFRKVKECVDVFSEVFKKKQRDLQKALEEQNTLPFSMVDMIFRLSTFDLFESLNQNVTTYFSDDTIIEIVNKSTAWYQRLFETQGGLKDAKASIRSNIDRFLDENFTKSMCELLLLRIEEEVKKKEHFINTEINKAMSQRREKIKVLLQEQAGNSQMIQSCQQIVSQLEERKRVLLQQKSRLE